MPLLLGTEHLGALFFSVFNWDMVRGKLGELKRGHIL